MKKKTRDVLSIVGAESLVVLLCGGAVFCLISRLNAGEHLTSNRYGANIPAAGGVVILSIVGAVLLAYLPGALWKEMNMSKADRKRNEKQKRKEAKQPRRPTSGMNLPWE